MILPNCDNFLNCLNGNHLCGVVEGFYGQPWTTEDRKRLFQRMNKMGLNTYIYAPKDDSKHRVHWREMYSVEEADHLTSLIDAARKNNMTFVYAISPGLDIAFSSSKEVTLLKRKLEQVASFGCSAFALLFDDIEVNMSEADRAVFQSFAQAQASVTNEVYQHLGQPTTFLFCPTEYCASRAVPDVQSSEYLNTIGNKLLPGIDVLWTGPKVISKTISVESIIELSKVLKRPPVIWDNIHANDYDPWRVFLGPYVGRSPELLPYIRGVVTNPNCEVEANFVALHTLAQWCRSNMDGVRKDLPVGGRHSPVHADIQLEVTGELGCGDGTSEMLDSRYQPQQALTAAVNDWLPEFYVVTKVLKTKQHAPTTITQTLPVVQTCTAATVTTPTSATGIISTPAVVSTSNNLPSVTPVALEVNQSLMQPAMAAAPVNSLVDPSDSESSSDSDSEAGEMPVAMETLPSPGSSPLTVSHLCPTTPPSFTCDSAPDSSMMNTTVDDIPVLPPLDVYAETTSVCGVSTEDQPVCTNTRDQLLLTDNLTFEEVQLLVGLLYLPFEYGSPSLHFLNEFEWLKTNAHVVAHKEQSSQEPDQEKAACEWRLRAEEFERQVEAVHYMAEKFSRIPNKVLQQNLSPYLWDVQGALSIMSAFVKWLGQGLVPDISQCNLQANRFSWASPAYREAYTNGYNEPWMFQGGLQTELKRLLPLEYASDLVFSQRMSVVPAASFCSVRPYQPSDEASVYEICLQTCDDGVDGTQIFADHPQLVGDRFVGPFLTANPELCFVLENQGKVVGYCLATNDAKAFHSEVERSWATVMQKKYPQPEKDRILSPAEEMINGWYEEQPAPPESIYSRFPALVRLNLLPSAYEDASAAKRLLLTTIAALRVIGCWGIHCQVHVGDQSIQETYTHLGLSEVPLDQPYCDDVLLYGRAI